MSESPNEPRHQPLELTVHESAEILRSDPKTRLLDVRQPWEREIARLEGSEILDEAVATDLLASGDRDARYIFMCHHGIRSLNAAAHFAQQGFKNVYSMSGGIHAWSLEVDPSIPTY